MVTFTTCLVLAMLGGAFAATLHKLPLSESEKCDTDAASGKMCIPDACSNTTCDVIPDAVCVADKCGCRARFFHFTKQDKIFVEVTRTCKASLDVKVAVAFIKRVLDNDEDAVAAVAQDPQVLLEPFKSLNILSGDVLRVLIAFLRKLHQNEPTEINTQRLRLAVDRLAALEQQTSFVDRVTDVSKILGLKGLKGSLVYGRSFDDLDDEAIQERHHKIFLWIMRVRNPNATLPINDTEADANDEEGMGEKSIFGIGTKVAGKLIGKAVGGKAGGTIGKVTDLLSNFLDEDHDPTNVFLMDEQTGFAIPLSDVDLEQLANDEDVEEKSSPSLSSGLIQAAAKIPALAHLVAGLKKDTAISDQDVSEKSFLSVLKKVSKVAGKVAGAAVGGEKGAAISEGANLLSSFLDEGSDMMNTIREGSHAGAIGLDLYNDIMGNVQNDDGSTMDESAQTLNNLYQMDLDIANGFQDFTDQESNDAEE